MEQSGEYRIAASREAVWTALNDPDVLARCLDGCQSMEKVADDQFRARVKAKVGPVSATFDADLALENIRPLQSYTINGSVKGGAAGFARGAAHVKLSDEGTATLLQYTVDASIGGKLAQVGSRLIDGAARKMAEDFFARFRDVVEQKGDGETATAAVTPSDAGVAPDVPAREAASEPRGYESSGRWLIWVVVLLALAVAMVLVF